MPRAFCRTRSAPQSGCGAAHGWPPTRAFAHTWGRPASHGTIAQLQDGRTDPWVVRRFRERTHRRAIVLADLRSPRLALGRTPCCPELHEWAETAQPQRFSRFPKLGIIVAIYGREMHERTTPMIIQPHRRVVTAAA